MSAATRWLDPLARVAGLDAHAQTSSSGSFESLLALQFGGPVEDILKPTITKPITDLTGRPGKRIRGRLVEMGCQLGQAPSIADEKIRDHCRRLAEAIEFLHAGSLAIDDLQDGSKVRRGQPALHVKYGVPLAVNIGNYLYFWPLELMGGLGLPAHQELLLYRIYHRTLVRAHLGQSMDVGIPIDTLSQERIFDVCMAAMELKSGALFSLGLLMGAVLTDPSDDLLTAIDRFGHGFGIGLQMFDDLGNLKGHLEPAKRWEDLVLRRPTWVWACAARYYSQETFRQFLVAAHQLPHDRNPLEAWFELHDFHHKAKQLAHQHLESCYKGLQNELIQRGMDLKPLFELRQLGREISLAYE